MSFMILVVSLYAFSILQVEGRERAAEAQVNEVVNRVALGVQETLQVAAARAETLGTADSTQLRYSHSITVPSVVQSWNYSISLDENNINATVPARDLSASVPTFNAAVVLPPVGTCDETYIVCTLSGTRSGTNTQIVMTYVFDQTVVPIVNKIEIA